MISRSWVWIPPARSTTHSSPPILVIPPSSLFSGGSYIFSLFQKLDYYRMLVRYLPFLCYLCRVVSSISDPDSLNPHSLNPHPGIFLNLDTIRIRIQVIL